MFLIITIISESDNHCHNSKPEGVRVGEVELSPIFELTILNYLYNNEIFRIIYVDINLKSPPPPYCSHCDKIYCVTAPARN